MTLDLSTLNETQAKAVQWQDGPLLVLAGPGSGKTRVLTFRIARLIEASPEEHYRILGLTFTTKAAAEMRERLVALVPDAGERVLLLTFHSFAGDILRQHGHLIGLRPDFTILSQDTDREAVVEEAMSIAGVTNEGNLSGQRLLPAITNLLDHAADESMAISLLKSINALEPEKIVDIYIAYRARLIDRNAMDFGSLMAESLRLLIEKPAVRRQIHRVYKYVAVDEFQDTNLCQYQLLSLLANPDSKNLFVVADDDQIIYQWNGASPERLQSLRQDFQMTVLQLPQNYRCPPTVIKFANRLIAHNISRSPDKQALQALKEPTEIDPIRVQAFQSFEEEAAWIADDIKSRPKSECSRCVVLARARKPLDTIVASLDSRGVPAYLATRKDEWTSAPLRALHSFLRLANARQDRTQLSRTCKSFYDTVGLNVTVADVMSAATSYEGDYLRAFSAVTHMRSGVDVCTARYLDRSLSDLVDRLDFRSFVLGSFAWFDELAKTSPTMNEFGEYEEEKQTWNELVSDVDAQYGYDGVTLHLLLQELDLRSKAPRPPVGAVPCYTIHASKGLEFRHVYLAGLVEDQLPSWAAVKKGEHSHEIQEERRMCFVAITRAEESLTLTYSHSMQGWLKKPSRFLLEMGLS